VLSHHGDTVSLNVTPAQFMSDAPDAHTGVMRVFEDMDFRLFYSGYTGVGSDAAPPAILKVLSHSDGDQLSFRITAMSDIAAGVQTVWITYMDLGMPDGEWKSLDLVQDPADPADWIGTLSGLPHPEDIRFMVQAVNGVGLVTLATNVGAYFIPDVDPATPPASSTNALPTTLAFVTPPTSGNYGSTATLTAMLTSAGQPLANTPISLTLGSQSVQLRTDATGQATHAFPLDATPGEYVLRASFAGNETYAPTGDIEAPFTIHKQPTHLALQAAINGSVRSFAGVLVDDDQNALGQQTVVFVMHSLSGPDTTLLAAFTDPAGLAIPDLSTVPPGQYVITAYFGGPVPATDIDLTNPLYGPSSASGTFDVNRMPSLGILDDFNRPNGAPGNQWQSRNFGSYRIFNHRLSVGAGGPLYWNAASFGPDQGAEITFVHVDPNASRQSLLLKVQAQVEVKAHDKVQAKVQDKGQGGSQPDWQQGAMAVVYDAKQHILRLETYQPNKPSKWTSYAATSITLHDGDRLGAMASADGSVSLFVNGNLVATVTLNTSDQAFFNNRGGYIGLWFMASKEALLDDFAGGTIVP
jgi:hypothetical protein